MSKVAVWIRHNQGVALSFVIITALGLWIYGCESKVESLVTPGKQVNAAELQVEIDFEVSRLRLEVEEIIAQGKLKAADILRMDELKSKLVNFLAITVDAGTVNPAGVVGMLFSVLGVGAVIDNRLKDKVIKNRPIRGIPLKDLKQDPSE